MTTPDEFRDGLFDLHTRRFGDVGEILMEALLDAGPATDIYHDLTHRGEPIEVKFSRVLAKHDVTIRRGNLLDAVAKQSMTERMVPFHKARTVPFDCNIQQIKKPEFTRLFYGLCFKDYVRIYSISLDDIDSRVAYSDKQHKGNVGEGQFHITNQNIQTHESRFLFKAMSYQEVLDTLS